MGWVLAQSLMGNGNQEGIYLYSLTIPADSKSLSGMALIARILAAGNKYLEGRADTARGPGYRCSWRMCLEGKVSVAKNLLNRKSQRDKRRQLCFHLLLGGFWVEQRETLAHNNNLLNMAVVSYRPGNTSQLDKAWACKYPDHMCIPLYTFLLCCKVP